MKISISLINPRSSYSYLSINFNQDIRNNQYFCYPLALATVAGIFYKNGISDIKIIDENVNDSINLANDSDIIGITGFSNQKNKIIEYAAYFKKMGKYVIIGGPFATIMPEEVKKYCDSVFTGDSEASINAFIEDYKNKKTKEFYRFDDDNINNTFISPYFDLLNLKKYTFAAIQTTRGCPHNCEYCSIFLHSGKKVKTKPADMVINELQNIYESKGTSSIIVMDDNTASDFVYFKELLRKIIIFQKDKQYPFRFYTQLSILIAKDEELLVLMAQAGIYIAFIGIETPIDKCLEETNKKHNLMTDIPSAVKKIQSYGISVESGTILGFDNDTKKSFDIHYDFFDSLSIATVYPFLLHAIPGTRLYKRISSEGRLLAKDSYAGAQSTLDPIIPTNIKPLNMSYEELVDGYKKHFTKYYSFRNFGKRLAGYMKIPVLINNEEYINANKKREWQIIKSLLRITLFYLVEEFPYSFFLYLKIIYLAKKQNRFYIAFHYLVHFKQMYSYGMKLKCGINYKTRYDRFFTTPSIK